MSAHKAPGRVAWLVLMAVSVVVVAAFGAFVAVAAAWERLRERLQHGPREQDVHPGEPRVYAPSDFRSMDEEEEPE